MLCSSTNALCTAVYIIAFSIRTTLAWNVSLTHAEFLFDSQPTIGDLARHKMLYSGKMKCLGKTSYPGHSVNPIFNFASLALHQKKSNHTDNHIYLSGVTIWMNDWFAPGHVFYTFPLMQALFSPWVESKIDRIVIQRPPCFRDDFCGTGLGVFHSFYQLYYQSIIPDNIPLYIRWQPNETFFQAVNLSSTSSPASYLPRNTYPFIPVGDITCFEYVLSRQNNFSSSYNSWTIDTVHRFRDRAYTLINIPITTNDRPTKAPEKTKSSKKTFTSKKSTKQVGKEKENKLRPDWELNPRFSYFQRKNAEMHPIKIQIGFVWRGINASRHMNNHQQFFGYLEQTLHDTIPHDTYSLSFLDSSFHNLTAKQQALFVYQHQIIISEHGAFQGNLMYARNGTLLIDLRSNAHLKNPIVASTYELFAEMFRMLGVFHAPVGMSGLGSFSGRSYTMQVKEMQEVVDLIERYVVKEKPYLLQ